MLLLLLELELVVELSDDELLVVLFFGLLEVSSVSSLDLCRFTVFLD
jgi:hypothetical protein